MSNKLLLLPLFHVRGSKVKDWLLELVTVVLSLIHSIVVTFKSAEQLIDTISQTVSGIWMGLI